MNKLLDEQRKEAKKAQQEQENALAEQKRKQKELNDNYKNMKVNLYSGEEGVLGIDSNKLIQ